jgi:hypothetical protein
MGDHSLIKIWTGASKFSRLQRNGRVITNRDYRGYDWKMGRDDCLYATRSMYQKCVKEGDSGFVPAQYTYRCVLYQLGFVNALPQCDEGRC